MKDLPKMYHNTIDKKIDNVQKMYTTLDKDKKEAVAKRKHIEYDRFTIEQKIRNIFNSPNYVYKADVYIELDNEVVQKRVVAYINNNIITIDNEHIPIDKIKDIYK